ncbi:MAG TPA: hypothetical protein VGV37_06460 [Aliidongia sp.]|uniref:hypothetical protein n=1 Tax=Aliidongia sp. TaxID=1914230 RepID=UPI002DDD6B3B|nr:hypothetical protein [Aliidongia sp.]HEV2674168.1 hypothetical protein [Aliidongia sp.]
MRKLSFLCAFVGGAGLAACSATQVADIQTALASPAGQALVIGLENFDPSVSAVVAKLNAGIAATASDKAMLCGAMSWANGLFVLSAPIAGISAADQTTETAAMAGVNSVCNTSTTDVASAVNSVLTAYTTTTNALKGAGVTAPAT